MSEIKNIDVIRRSHIELYEKCPYAFYLEVIEEIKNRQDLYAQVGIDLHELFDKYSYKKNKTNPEKMFKEFMEIYDKYPNDMFLGSGIGKYREAKRKDDFSDRAYVCIENFLKLKENLNDPLISEQQIIFSIREDLPKLSITMDRIDEVDGKLEIGDYKTGVIMTGKQFTTNLQVPLYIYAIEKHYNKKVDAFNLYFVKVNKSRRYERISDDVFKIKVKQNSYETSVSEAVKRVENVLESILAGDFLVKRDMLPYTCRMCQFHEKQCNGKVSRIWSQNINEKERD